MGEPSLEPPKGGCSYPSAASATACLRAHSFFGTCRFSAAIIGAVSVWIRHSSADAGTPLRRPLRHHCFRNTVLAGISCRSNCQPADRLPLPLLESGLSGMGILIGQLEST